jgi:hypothetical protein
MKTNFQAGCSTIASSITSHGVSTASNATPTVMATNIDTACNNYYNTGYNAGNSAGAITSLLSNMTSVHDYGTGGITSATSSYTFTTNELYIVLCSCSSTTEVATVFNISTSAEYVSYSNNGTNDFCHELFAIINAKNGETISITTTSGGTNYSTHHHHIYKCNR